MELKRHRVMKPMNEGSRNGNIEKQCSQSSKPGLRSIQTHPSPERSQKGSSKDHSAQESHQKAKVWSIDIVDSVTKQGDHMSSQQEREFT